MIKKLKIGLLSLAFLSLILSGGFVNAAYNDVVPDANTVINVASMNLVVSGSSNAVASLTVNSGSFGVSLESGSSLTVTSADRTTFTVGQSSQFTSAVTCTSTQSKLVLTGHGTVSVTVTPTGTACETNTGSGGGGGGGTHNNDNAATPAVPANEEKPADCTAGVLFSASTGRNCNAAAPAIPAGCTDSTAFSPLNGQSCGHGNAGNPASGNDNGNNGNNGHHYAFGTFSVKRGSKGEACKAWQTFFNEKAGAHLALDGHCGPLTIAFAKGWQKAHGLVADGILGPKSRAEADRE